MRKSILFLAAVAMMFVFASCGGNSPKDVAKDAAEMMKSGDYDGLVDLMAFDDEGMTKEEKEAAITLTKSMLKEKMSKMIEEKDGIEKYEIGEEKISDDGKTAEVKVKFFFGDGTENEDTMDLVLVDDKWMLSVE